MSASTAALSRVGQSLWLDQITRGLLDDATRAIHDDGIRKTVVDQLFAADHHRAEWLSFEAGGLFVDPSKQGTHYRKAVTAATKAAGASACTQWPASGIVSNTAAGNSRSISGRCSGRT
jgi:hypothetical protein